MSAVYATSDFEVRPHERRVLWRGAPVTLGARAFDVLVALIERRDRVVTKAELLALVWPGVVVGENNLTVQISALRKALGVDVIATVAGRGYRFATPLRDDGEPKSARSSATVAERRDLPPERSSFIGREPQIAAVRQLLASHRLVTLTGIGGAGKTRLALRVAALEQPRFADGVLFVDMVPVSDPGFVEQYVTAACGVAVGDVPSQSSRPMADRIAMALAPRHCLLLIDNCEHLLDPCADLIDALLTRCPRLDVLATSREALSLDGEQVLSVPPLSLPLDDAGDEVTDAMWLFAERAKAVNAAFVLDGRSRKPVAEICRRLDGIPLAIEFAAARAAHLSAQDLAERLGDRLQLLGGARARLGRQQTLAATMDWSHDLLSAPEQTLFRRLSVFADAFTLRAAEAVCGGEDMARFELLDLLASLVAKSLVTVATDGVGETRYRLLETVRLYAEGKLEAARETALWRARHRDAWLAWLEATPLEALTLDVDAIAAVGREINHLRTAAQACGADDRPDLLARLASRLMGFRLTGNWYREAFESLDQALAEADRLTIEERVACHTAFAALHLMANDVATGLGHAERGVELAGPSAGGFDVAALAFRGFARAIQASAYRRLRRTATRVCPRRRARTPAPRPKWATGSPPAGVRLRASGRQMSR